MIASAGIPVGNAEGRVTVLSPARIHFGLLQLSENYPTINMGFGGTLVRPRWILKAAVSPSVHLETARAMHGIAPDITAAAETLLHQMTDVFGQRGFTVQIIESVPSHRGLGSKTSLLCGIVAAVCTLVGKSQEWAAYRPLTNRGGTSGIGINAAVDGGLILDSGHREEGHPIMRPSSLRPGRPIPKVAARWEVRKWPFLLALPNESAELHGAREVELFQSVTPIPTAEARDLAALVLYDLIPALSRHDEARTLAALDRMQHSGMKQREWRAQPKRVHELRETFIKAGAQCVALSSMGPALAVFSTDPRAMLKRLEAIEDCQITMTGFRNRGIRLWKSWQVAPDRPKAGEFAERNPMNVEE